MTEQIDDEPQPAVASAPGAGGRFGAPIRKSGYLQKWLLLGVTIGFVAGLGAVIFYLALKYTGEFLLGYVGGYHIPTPAGEGGARGDSGFRRAWAIPLVTTGGALLSAFIVAKLAPEATGHGTDQAIEAVHGDPRAIRFRAVLVKMVASALTIGSGGSARPRHYLGGITAPADYFSCPTCHLVLDRYELIEQAACPLPSRSVDDDPPVPEEPEYGND